MLIARPTLSWFRMDELAPDPDDPGATIVILVCPVPPPYLVPA